MCIIIGIKNVKLYEKSIVWLTKNLHQLKQWILQWKSRKLAASMNTTTNLCYILCGFEIVRINFKTIQVETAKSLRTVCNLLNSKCGQGLLISASFKVSENIDLV